MDTENASETDSNPTNLGRVTPGYPDADTTGDEAVTGWPSGDATVTGWPAGDSPEGTASGVSGKALPTSDAPVGRSSD